MRRPRRLTRSVSRLRFARAVVSLSILLVAGCADPAAEDVPAGQAQSLSGRPLVAQLSRLGLDGPALVRNALALHSGVAAAAAEVPAGAADQRLARSALYPQIGLDLDAGLDSDGAEAPALKMRLTQLLTDFGQTALKIARSDLATRRAYLDFQIALEDAANEAVAAVLELELYRGLVALRAEELSEMRGLEGRLKQRQSAGAAAAPEVLEMRRRVAEAEFRLTEAQLMLAEAEAALLDLANGTLKSGGMPPPPARCRASAGRAFPNVEQARLDVAIGEADVELARRAKLPRVAVEGVAGQPLDGGGGSVGVRLNIGTNVFQGGGHQARIDAVSSRLDGQRAALERVLQRERLQTSALVRRQATLAQRAEVLSRQISLADEARALYASQYFDLGTRDLMDLLRAEEDFFALRADELSATKENVEVLWTCALRGEGLADLFNLEGYTLHGLPISF